MRAILAALGVLSIVACGSDDSAGSGNPPGPSNNSGGNTVLGPQPGVSPNLGGCAIFPADNPWNQDVSAAAVSAKSAAYLAKMSPDRKLHPDWGTVAENYGFPLQTGADYPPVPITFDTSWGPRESEKLPCPSGGGDFCYPIPPNAKIEEGDRHLIFLDTKGAPSACTLYELYNTQDFNGTGYTANNGAIFHLDSNTLRPDGWTSADAAGLPILPGLVRFEEVKAGKITHAIRFTMSQTQQGYIHPATHAAGKADTDLPPMGLRLRLKASVNITAPAEGMVIVEALKKYGLLLADNGSNWYLSGDQNDGWKDTIDNVKKALDQIKGGDFEVVDTGPVSTANLD